MIPSDDVPDPVAELVEEFNARRRRGEAPSLTEYVERIPEQGERIRQMLEMALKLEQAASGRFSATGSHHGPLPDMKLPGEIGGYRILREAGRGGMGIVYEAEQIGLGRRVALKVLPAAATGLERFRREAQAAASLHHPHIVPVHEVREENGLWFYAMQYIAGHSLDRVIGDLRKFRNDPTTPFSDSSGSLSPRSADRGVFFRSVARIGIQAGRALHHAHGQGIIHRDVKPGNLMLDESGHVWVADFGLAKTEQSDLTQTDVLLGTPRYLAPELLDGYVADPQSDGYALGLTLYELLVLKPAFAALDKSELFKQIRNGTGKLRSIDPSIPRDLETIVLKACHRERSERYVTLGDFADDLQRFLDGRPVQARPLSKATQAWRWAKRNPWVASLGSIAAMLLLAVGIGGPILGWKLQSARETAEEEKSGRIRSAYEKAILASSNRRDLHKFIAAVDEAEAAGIEISPQMRLDVIRAANGLSDSPRVMAELQRVDLDSLPSEERGQFELWNATVRFGSDDARAEEYLRAAMSRELPPADRAYAKGLAVETTPDAIDHFRAAIRLDVFHQPARSMCCIYMQTLGRLDDAIALARESADLFPDDPEFPTVMACSYGLLGNDAAAAEACRRLRKEQADDVLALAKAYSNGGRVFRHFAGYGALELKTLFQAVGDRNRAIEMNVLGFQAKQSGAAGLLLARLPTTHRQRLKVYLLYLQEELDQGRAPRPQQLVEFATLTTAHPDGMLLLAVASARYQVAMSQPLRPDSPDSQVNELREVARVAEIASETPGLTACRDVAIDLAIAAHSLLCYEKRRGIHADPKSLEKAISLLRKRLDRWGEPPTQHLIWMVRLSLQAGDRVVARRLLDSWDRRVSNDLDTARARARLEFASEAYPPAMRAALRVLRVHPFEWEMIRIWTQSKARLAN